MYYERLVGALEALLFAAGEPLTVGEIAEYLHIEKAQVWSLLTALKEQYSAENRGLMIRELDNSFQLVTKADFYEVISVLCKSKEIRLSNAALETLSIIAFKQPVTRAEIEAIRGVKADRVLNTLLDLELITEAGRKKALGTPILYATTAKFLSVFGLTSLDELPIPAEDDKEDSDQLQPQLIITK